MPLTAPAAPYGLTVPAATPALHDHRSRSSRGRTSGRIARHIAAQLQAGRKLHAILDDREVTSQLDPDGRAVPALRGV